MIAVLAIPNPKQTESSSKNFARQRVQSMNSIVSMVTATSEDEFGGAKPPFIPSSRKSSLGEEEEWTIHTPSSMVVQNTVTKPDKKIESNQSVDPSQPPSPARMIYLYNKPHQQTRKQKRAVIVHSEAVGRTLFELHFRFLFFTHFSKLISFSKYIGYQSSSSLWCMQRMAEKGKNDQRYSIFH